MGVYRVASSIFYDLATGPNFGVHLTLSRRSKSELNQKLRIMIFVVKRSFKMLQIVGGALTF